MFLCGFGCSSSKPAPDPLADWQLDFKQPDQLVVKDYQNFIQNLTGNTNIYVPVQFYKDETGQHAAKFEVFEKNTNASWQYVLIYDKENKRVKAIKYGYRRYQS
jgi:hypothetical protein